MDHAIWAEGLVKRFGETTALAGVDLAVRTGTVLGLLGPNGAGKTTAVRILATLLQPDAGRATVGGHDVVGDAHRVRQLIGLTGQYASVDEGLTGTENLLLIGRLLGMPRGKAKQRARDLLARFDLVDAADRRPRPTRVACAGDWTWRPAWSAGRGCCTWTSRQAAWTRGAARSCGTSCAAWWPME
jgi:oleandomycin transport system ATP-binding protein